MSTTKPNGRSQDAAAEGGSPAADPPGGIELPGHFIPLTRKYLRASLLQQLAEDGADIPQFTNALHCLASWRHSQYRARLLHLLDDYLPFLPDGDTTCLADITDAEKAAAHRRFIDGVQTLLESANYRRLREEDIQALLDAKTPYGLHLNVDLTAFDDVLIYYRGTDKRIREARNPWLLYLRKERFDEPLFQRLFLLLKLKPMERRIEEVMAEDGIDRARAEKKVRRIRGALPVGVTSSHIYLKLFKRIPKIDVEMLFPNTKIAFRPFDKLKLLVTAGGGTVAGVAGTASKLLVATNPITLAIALAGLSGVVFRQVMGFFNTRNRYMMVLAQNLYFCTLANNRGALTLIADRAEEEDTKEDMLLYVFLARRDEVSRADLDEVASEIQTFLQERCGVSVTFDLADACGA
ncbi:hypothetical protein A7A08_00835 [Methyloligella halotolerans]|uniref:DUF3754 domain-containing protein n=1 Tax=Methyloligella halotolerans TaxID=1177755 RepID=A0A1E2S3T7_9HYPH|nr:DUF3754 domain-containing protein [Methyloligella halotolerans]ODA68999.1 hypothetical protein A7A08_00835 [Methyloligella halotolerans]